MNSYQYNSSINKSKRGNNYLTKISKQLGCVLFLMLILILFKFGNTTITNNINNKIKTFISMDYTVQTESFIKNKLPALENVFNDYKSKILTVKQFKLDYLPVHGKITSNFGNRTNPLTKKSEFHKGIDIGCKNGSKVLAVYNGIVKEAENSSTYGLKIEIDHQDGFFSTYAHLSKINVSIGEKVKQGDVIGLSGNSGESTAPHLHFELAKSTTPVNPIAYLNASGE